MRLFSTVGPINLTSKSTRSQKLRYRPALDPLEERVAPAVYFVDNLGDSGAGQNGIGDLRYAITQSNASIDVVDFIYFLEELAGTVELQSALPAIDNHVTIEGPALGSSPGQLWISRAATSEFRILTINAGKEVRIKGVTIHNGRVDQDNGGGILNRGTLWLDKVVVTGNHAWQGGGIYSEGVLQLWDCDISTNTAEFKGGGIYLDFILPQPGQFIAGNAGNTRIVNNTVQSTFAPTAGGGVYIRSGAWGVAGQSEISGNRARDGAGVYNGTNGQFALTDSTISGNITDPGNGTVGAAGGGIYSSGRLEIHGSTISNHDMRIPGVATYGGGIYAWGGSIDIRNSLISGNAASEDGGAISIAAFATVLLDTVRIENNTAFRGGALYVNSDLPVINSRGRGNRSTGGGIVIHVAPNGRVTGSLNNISMNIADGPGLAAIQVDGGSLSLDQTIIDSNQSIGLRVDAGSVALQDNEITANQESDILFAGGTSTLTGSLGLAGDVKQTAGNVDLDGTFAVTELFKLEGGTFHGLVESTLNAQQAWQTAGSLSFDIGSLLDIGANLLIDGGTGALDCILEVAVNYQQTGGTAWLGADAVTISGQALLSGGALTLHGPVSVAQGMEILAGGLLQIGTDGAVNGNVVNSGIISVGALAAGQTLIISGDFTQTSGGILRLELGIASDHVGIGGNASLAGTLEVGVEDGYTPSIGVYTPISWGSFSGEFDAIYLPALPEPDFWIVQYDEFGLNLIVETES